MPEEDTLSLEEEKEQLLEEIGTGSFNQGTIFYIMVLLMKDVIAQLKSLHSEIIRMRIEAKEGEDLTLDEALEEANERSRKMENEEEVKVLRMMAAGAIDEADTSTRTR